MGPTEPYYDPYDVEIDADPYPVFARLREEAPLYYNEQHDFFAVSRYEDVERGLRDARRFISGRGGILELIKADFEMPSGVLIFEDPPTHTIHRGLLSRVFTPRRVAELEPKIRELCAQSLDPLVGTGGFDFIADLGAQMPMRVIGMLFGIPDEDQEAIRDRVDENLRTEAGEPMRTSPEEVLSGEMFGDYIDWRAAHPSDDLMTELLQAEFEDETGTTRRLRREEILHLRVGGRRSRERDHDPPDRLGRARCSPTIPTSAGSSWPTARSSRPRSRSSCGTSRRRHTSGATCRRPSSCTAAPSPPGAPCSSSSGGANRDDRRFDEPDRFDIHRTIRPHLTFGYGIHFCLGAALARLEGRVALDEVLSRFPEWEVDTSRAQLAPTSTVRGWETLPVSVP